MSASLVGSEMCIRDSARTELVVGPLHEDVHGHTGAELVVGLLHGGVHERWSRARGRLAARGRRGLTGVELVAGLPPEGAPMPRRGVRNRPAAR
eukprot:3797090-Alexandrium_andersonii.AAC.1